ncbi:ankyrin repeat-containing domain protein, partial [Baffinella frigidus]
LLADGTDIEERGPDEETPLHAAAFNGHEALVRLLLEHEASPLARDDFGMTPLHLAVDEGHESVVPLLFHGASAVLDDGGRTPLDIANAYSDHAMVTTSNP